MVDIGRDFIPATAGWRRGYMGCALGTFGHIWYTICMGQRMMVAGGFWFLIGAFFCRETCEGLVALPFFFFFWLYRIFFAFFYLLGKTFFGGSRCIW